MTPAGDPKQGFNTFFGYFFFKFSFNVVNIIMPKKLISDFALNGDKDAEAEKNAIVQPEAQEPAPAPAPEGGGDDLGIEI